MTYTELLKQNEWKLKCNSILQRDKHICQDCGSIGFHNGTVYSTESLAEVDKIINEKILIGDKFSSLIEQTFNGYTECDKVDLSERYVEIDGKLFPINNIRKEQALQGYVIWEPYHNCKIREQEQLDNIYINKIWLYKPKGFFFSNIWEFLGYTTIVSTEKFDSFDFKLHRYRKYVVYSDWELSTYPMAILKFDSELTNKYYLIINEKSISLTYKNYVFFVHLNSFQFKYKGLNVHHKYYVNGLKPWEYDNKALITLCSDCHQKRHEVSVPKYKTLSCKEIECHCKKCDRCGGSGYLPQYFYVQNGICFKCGGEGVIVD